MTSALIIGTGSIGQRHLRNLKVLRPEMQISILRSTPGVPSAYSVEGVQAHATLEGALESPPDMVVLANPAPFHVKIAQACVDRGAHVLIEKPLADSLIGVDELLNSARNAGRVVLVAYNLRFHPALRRMRESLAAGEIGRLLSIQASVGQYLPDWRQDKDYRNSVSAQSCLGGGVLLELSHELDYVRWLGGEITSLSASGDHVSALEIDVEDCAEVTLHFACGAIGHVHMDMLDHAAQRVCRIVGSAGTLEWRNADRLLRLYRAADKSWQTLWSDNAFDSNQMYMDEMSHFLHCCEGRESACVTGADASRTLELVLAAKSSALSGKKIAV